MKKRILFLIIGILLIFPVKAYDSKSYIDYPSNGPYSGNMKVSGWIMSNANINQIKAYIDGENVEYSYERKERKDVNKLITGYGENPTPGFEGEIDTSNINEGNHTLKIDFYSNEQLITTNTRDFTIEKKATIYIDQPETVKTNQIDIKGWVMSTDKDYKLKTYIDNNEINIDYTKEERQDVLTAITGYGDNNTLPGFKSSISSSILQSGNHIIKIDVLDKNNNILSSAVKSFFLEKYKSKSYLDYPTNGTYSGTMIIDGWIMSTANINQIKAYIDDENIDYTYERKERKDVTKAITGYGVNPTPGFTGKANISQIPAGTHKLKIEFISNTEVVNIIEKTVKIEKKGKIYLDNPKEKVEGTTLTIQGWAMSNDLEPIIKTYIDNNEVDINYNKENRQDVLKAIKGFGDEKTNTKPGFKGNIDISNLTNGTHIITVKLQDKSGNEITSISKSFNLDKYYSLMEIDNPIQNVNVNGTSINIKGWYLSFAENTKLEILIDDTNISDSINMVTRKDVIKVYGQKFNKTENDKIGFNFNADLKEFTDGNKTITFNVIDTNTNELIISRKRTINLKKYMSKMELDAPAINANITGTNLTVKGWAISTSKYTRLQVLINDEEINDEITYQQREDVYNAYGNVYHFNKTDKVGYKVNHDLRNINDGNLKIKINIIDNTTNEILKTINRTVNLKKFKSKITLDEPAANTTAIGTNLTLRGWFISTSDSKRLQILVEGEDISNKINFQERPDVYRAYGNEYNFGEHDLVGFKAIHDVSNLKDGKITVVMNVIDNITNDIIGTSTKKITIKKYDGMLTIDYPTRYNFSRASTLTVQGWELSDLDNSIVKVFIDNTEFPVTREDRADVHNVYPTLFGGIAMNEKPGFTSSIQLNSVTEGMHKVKIKLYSRLNELITEKSLNIFIYSSTYFGIDVSSWQGNIDWDQVGKSGIDFAILRAGYGSNFTSQDDIQFINYVNGCVRNKIPYGVYIYSYATEVDGTTTVNDNNQAASASSEAAHALRILNSLTPEQKAYLKLPVFIDMEEDRYAGLGMQRLTTIADNFCTIIQANGYKCGVYANKNWLNNYLNNNYLSSKYDIWLAHYVDVTDYNGIYQIWQNSSTGHIAGVNSGFVDLDISFKKYW